MNAFISEELRNQIINQVIKDYEAQKRIALCEKRCKSRPLGRAQRYFGLLTDELLWRSNDERAVTRRWKGTINEYVKNNVRERYGLELITELEPEKYDEANEYAIELFTQETKESKYFKDTIDVFGLPWIRNEFGKLVHTRYKYSWEEWKTKCYNETYY